MIVTNNNNTNAFNNVTNYNTPVFNNVTNYDTTVFNNVTSYDTNVFNNVTNYTNYDTTTLTNETMNIFNNNTISNYFSEYISSDKYAEYSLIMSISSLLISIVLVILYIVGMCRRYSEDRALRYMMYNHGTARHLPIGQSLSQA
jgi:hypothetical protein